MNDEQFEATMECLRDELADKLRARDTAQREALARVEAERDRLIANYEHLIEQHMPRTGHGCEEGWSRVVEARELQAQLAEAVGLLNKVRGFAWESDLPQNSIMARAEVIDFLARYAQVEQQEAQGAQAGDERAAKAIYDADRSLFMTKREYADLHPQTKTRLLRMARAALATQPAAGEPVATWVALTAAGQLRKGDKIRFRFGEEILMETVALVLDAGTEREEVIYNRKRNFYFITSKALTGTSSAKEVEVLRTVAAPPAAAHGDEAVRKDAERYRWLSKRDRWASTHCDFDRGGVYLRHRVVWFEPGEWKHSEGQTLDEAIDAAMRAQAGEGGEV